MDDEKNIDRNEIDHGDYRWNPALKLMQHKTDHSFCPVRTNKERAARGLPAWSPPQPVPVVVKVTPEPPPAKPEAVARVVEPPPLPAPEVYNHRIGREHLFRNKGEGN